MARLWDKGESVDDLILSFTVGDDAELDCQLVRFDVRASKGHALGLAESGYLKAGEADELVNALDECLADFEAGRWTIQLEDEDCHTALETQLTERVGELGKRIHLGRSRNDQVLAALRLYILDAIDQIRTHAVPLLSCLDQMGANTTPIPGYTHQQRAMPSSIGLWASGFAAGLRESLEALSTPELWASRSPLGSAAGYGTPGLTLDREFTAEQAGFASCQTPVTAVQSSRGKAEAALALANALILQDLGRIAADLCLFATQEFGFVTLPTAFTTGSSIMPQKRNPDVFEIVRAHSAQAPADLQAILAITAKMTSGYHRDLQLIKAPLFRSIASTLNCLKIMGHALLGVTFNTTAISEAMDSSLNAAERAYELVSSTGISFREAYRRVASELH